MLAKAYLLLSIFDDYENDTFSISFALFFC